MRCDTKSVLVVDDVIPNIKLLSAILHLRNYTVYEATSGVQALALAKEKEPNLVVLDIMMPGMDGFEVCRRLKEDPGTADSAVIFVSAKTSAEDKIRGLELGAVDYIAKPFQKAEVLARVEAHMALQLAKARLQESERRYSTLVEASQDGIFLWSQEAGVFFLNQTMRRMLKIQPEQKVELKEFLTPSELERFLKALPAQNGTAPVQPRELELSLLPKDAGASGHHPIHTLCSLVSIELGGQLATLTTVKDITERRLFEQQLQLTQKMEALGLLSAGIAHDFNNILSLINGYAELALMEVGPHSPLSEKLTNILSAGRNAVSLTRGLLAFTRNKGMELEPLDLSEELRRIHSILAGGMPKSIEFICQAPNEKIPASGDPAMFQQMIVSLCLNARDAMPKGGRLTLRASTARLKAPSKPGAARPAQEAALCAVIEVLDSGCGIPESVKSRIFDPFFTTKADGRSSGLGLTIAERVARSHKGWIEVESAVGAGSSFRVAMPLNSSSKAVETPSARPSYKHKVRAELTHALVADADEAELAITRYFLEKEGYSIRVAPSAKEAIASLESQPAACGLLVLSRSALEASPEVSVKDIRNRWPQMKMLLASESGATPLADVPLIKKPFSAKDLLQAIDSL